MRRRTRRRGAMYAAVLMIAMVVAIFGVTGLQIAQRSMQAQIDADDMVQARFAAESAIELAVRTSVAEATWESVYPERGWIGPFDLPRGTCSWRLEHASQAVDLGVDHVYRLYGRGRSGAAARVFSVLAFAYSPVPDNLLENAGFEQGMRDWHCDGGCSMSLRGDDPAEGRLYLRVFDRPYDWSGPQQDIADDLKQGVLYMVSGKLRSADGSDQLAKITIEYETDWQGKRWAAFGPFTIGGEWTACQDTLTLNWSGALESAYLYVETWGSRGDIDIDDLYLFEMPDEIMMPRLVPIDGTWRTEDAAM